MKGAFNAASAKKGGWVNEYDELRRLFSTDEMRSAEEAAEDGDASPGSRSQADDSAERSSLNAHYTDPTIVDWMWKAMERMGFKGGRVLEPSMGSGNFFGLLPKQFRSESKLFGVELDKTTAMIAELLYPRAVIQAKGFQDVRVPDGFFDTAIGNVPFGNYHVHDADYTKHNALIHDFFFLKSLDKVRPGGLVAFITSRGTLNKANSRIREHLASKADLVAAIELPGETFSRFAGTKVITDLVILRKRAEGEAPKGEAWTKIHQVPDPLGGETIPLNEYFVKHPEMIMGKLDRSGTMNKADSVNVTRPEDFEARMQKALESLPADAMTYSPTGVARPEPKLLGDTKVKDGAFHVDENGAIVRRVKDQFVPHEVTPKDANRIKAAIELRKAWRLLVEAELKGNADAERKSLNEAYNAFTLRWGYINNAANRKVLRIDPDYPVLAALEHWNKDEKTATKADIFKKSTIRQNESRTTANSVTQAIGYSLNETGKVSASRIAELLGVDEAKAIQMAVAEGVAFEDPTNGGLALGTYYLSGNVRRKLEEAIEAAKIDPRFAKNVAALKNALPADVDIEQISFRLGSAWIPPADIAAFAAELFSASPEDFRISHNANTGGWSASFSNRGSRLLDSETAKSVFGTPNANFIKLLEASLNNRPFKVPIPKNERDGASESEMKVLREKYAKLSVEADIKAKEIQETFKHWLWEDDARRVRLHRYYNDNFNFMKKTVYDGSHQQFPGMNPEKKLRPHQANAVWRKVLEGTALFAHEVGTGKTFTMIASAMEEKRLGLAKKSCIACLSANVGQIANSAKEWYPGARILRIEQFDPLNRKRVAAQIATGDWDIIILTHDNLSMIPLKPETIREYIEEELDEMRSVLRDLEEQEAEPNVLGSMRNAIMNKEASLEAALTSRKDDAVYFEDLGIDNIFVDEAHKFKNLPIYTTLNGVKGIASKPSQRASDMLAKFKYLQRMNNGRGVALATGTPISNTLSELFVMQKLLMHEEMKRAGIGSFDSWQSTFANVDSTLEMNVAGIYKVTDRLSRFVNLPELLGFSSNIFDVVHADSVNEIVRPKKLDDAFSSSMSREQEAYFAEIQHRSQNLPKDKTIDNMLKISTDGRLMAVDLRLVDPNAKDYNNSKVNWMIANVMTYNEQHPGKTQMIFCDVGVNPTEWGFSLYEDIIGKLVKKGIPRDKIIDFTKIKDSDKRLAAQDRIMKGDALVAIGSTETLGTGVNAQENLVAIHHLDVPFKPAELEQRQGRAWRDGNLNKEIYVKRYITAGSFDAFMWQLIDKKSKFIEQVMDADPSTRIVFDEETETLTPAQVFAIATGDERLLRAVQLEQEIMIMDVAEKSHRRQKDRAIAMVPTLTSELANSRKATEDYESDMATVAAAREKDPKFSMKIGDIVFTDKGEAATAMADVVKNFQRAYNNNKTKKNVFTIGAYQGLALEVTFTSIPDSFMVLTEVGARGKRYHPTTADATDGSAVNSLVSILSPHIMKGRLENSRQSTLDIEKELVKTKAATKKQFANKDTLLEKRRELEELRAELASGAPPKPKTEDLYGIEAGLSSLPTAIQAGLKYDPKENYERPPQPRPPDDGTDFHLLPDFPTVESDLDTTYEALNKKASRISDSARSADTTAHKRTVATLREQAEHARKALKAIAEDPARGAEPIRKALRRAAVEGSISHRVVDAVSSLIEKNPKRYAHLAVSVLAGESANKLPRGVYNEARDLILLAAEKGEKRGLEAALHEIGHGIVKTLAPQERAAAIGEWTGTVRRKIDELSRRQQEALRRNDSESSKAYAKDIDHLYDMLDGKPRHDEVPEHLYDLADPDEWFAHNWARYQSERLGGFIDPDPGTLGALYRSAKRTMRDFFEAIKSAIGKNDSATELWRRTSRTPGEDPTRGMLLRRAFADPESAEKFLRAGDDQALLPRRGQDIDPSIKDVVGRVAPVLVEAEKPFGQRIREAFENLTRDWRTRIVEQIADRFIYADKLDKRAGLDIDQGSHQALLMRQNTTGLLEVILHHGMIDNASDGSMNARYREGTVGLLKRLKPIIEAGQVNNMLAFMMGERALAYHRADRDPGISIEDAEALAAIVRKHPIVAQGARAMQEAMDNILDYAEANGVINRDGREQWIKAFYLPFFRESDDLKQGIFELTGKHETIRDPWENWVRMAWWLMDTAADTKAKKTLIKALRAAEDAEGTSLLEYLPTKSEIIDAEKKKAAEQGRELSKDELKRLYDLDLPSRQGADILTVYQDGRRRKFAVKDPDIARLVKNLGPKKWGALMKYVVGARRLLSTAVTHTPAFVLANTIRDSVNTMLVSGEHTKPWQTVTNALAAYTHDPRKAKLLAAGGASSGFYSWSPTNAAKRASREMNLVADKKSPKDLIYRLWRFVEEVGNSTELGSRMAVNDAALARGASDAEAAGRALDLINYQMQGSNEYLAFFLDTVPFLRARISGLYKVGRSATTDARARTRFWLGGLAMSAASIGLAEINRTQNAEEYERLEEWDKDANWHFWIGGTHIRVPKPFEVGQFFGTIPERALGPFGFVREGSLDKGDWDLAADRITALLTQTFEVNPIPQVISPIVEQIANKNMFTGRAIVPAGMDRLEPQMQYTPRTPSLARGISDLTPDWDAPIFAQANSPSRVEALLRGYFGTMASYAFAVSDIMLEPIYGKQPDSKDPLELTIGRLVDVSPQNTSRHVNRFYEFLKQAEEAHLTAREYARRGRLDEARKYAKEHVELLRFYKPASSLRDQLTQISLSERRVAESKTLSAEKKAEQLDRLRTVRNELTRNFNLAVRKAKTPTPQ